MTGHKPICHVLMAVDASGSMYQIADDVRGGYNQYLDGLTADHEVNYRITTATFNTHVDVLCKDIPVEVATRLDDYNYQPGSATALRDAIGALLTSLTEDTAEMSEDDRVLVVVNTDGKENASREWTAVGIRNFIKAKDADPRWGFVFIGAGPDVWRQGEDLGFASTQSVHSSGGTRGTYAGMTVNTTEYARGGASAQEVADNIGAASGLADKEGGSGGN